MTDQWLETLLFNFSLWRMCAVKSSFKIFPFINKNKKKHSENAEKKEIDIPPGDFKFHIDSDLKVVFYNSTNFRSIKRYEQLQFQ
jgi:hypothetical protein